MNILFLTIGKLNHVEEHGIYSDLLREFRDHDHSVYIVTPNERRSNAGTELFEDSGVTHLRVKTGNITKTNIIEKGLSTLFLESRFMHAINKYLDHVKFDLIIYSTPPVTFARVVKNIKNRDRAASYLLLKDIFPQNAVDLEILSVRNPIYWWFRRKEIQLYKVSDFIGCMSEANVKYILDHNLYIDNRKVHVSPNSLDLKHFTDPGKSICEIRSEYGIPLDSTVFLYGGNIGKPQGISFLLECLRENSNYTDRFFVICGTGTEYPKVKEFITKEALENVLLMPGLGRSEYRNLVHACDVGLTLLDRRFTIPNYPSRVLSYMEASKPVLAATDINTDLKDTILTGKFGWWCESGDVIEFNNLVDKACSSTEIGALGSNAREYLEKHFTAYHTYSIIMNCFKRLE